jgi:hypothetical protein
MVLDKQSTVVFNIQPAKQTTVKDVALWYGKV